MDWLKGVFMKKTRFFEKVLITLVMALIVTGLLSTKANAKTNIKVTAPSGKILRVARNKKVKLKTIVKGLADKKVTYKSEDPSIADVTTRGYVKGVKPGKTKIVVTSEKNKKIKKTIKVIVYKKSVKKIKLNKRKITINKGKKYKLIAKVSPKKNVNNNLKFSSSNKKVATVNKKGLIKALGCGTAKIVVKATDGSNKKATCIVDVVETGIKNVSIRHYSALNVELITPVKLELEDFKVYSKYLSNTKYMMEKGIVDVHTGDNIHYEIVFAEKLEFSTYVKVQIDKLTGVKETEIVIEKSNLDKTIYCKKNNKSVDVNIFGKVGYGYTWCISDSVDWMDIDYPLNATATNLPEGVSLKIYGAPRLEICIDGVHRSKLIGHKSVVTIIDTNGKKVFVNVYFYVGDDSTVVTYAEDKTCIAYTPNKLEGLQGDKYIDIYPSISKLDSLKDEYYFNCKEFKAEGLPDNLFINTEGSLEVTDLSKKVKPGVYNIKISGVTPSGENFTFKFKLTLVEGIVVSGKIIDQMGKPIADEEVRITKENNVNSENYVELMTADKNGNYSVRLLPGYYNITSRFYNSYMQDFSKNTKFDIKSNYYKMTFAAPKGLVTGNKYVVSYNILIKNSDTNTPVYSYSNIEYGSNEVKDPIEYYAFLRKGANYTIDEPDGVNWTLRVVDRETDSATVYAVVGKNFKCTGQKVVGLNFKQVGCNSKI